MASTRAKKSRTEVDAKALWDAAGIRVEQFIDSVIEAVTAVVGTMSKAEE